MTRSRLTASIDEASSPLRPGRRCPPPGGRVTPRSKGFRSRSVPGSRRQPAARSSGSSARLATPSRATSASVDWCGGRASSRSRPSSTRRPGRSRRTGDRLRGPNRGCVSLPGWGAACPPSRARTPRSAPSRFTSRGWAATNERASRGRSRSEREPTPSSSTARPATERRLPWPIADRLRGRSAAEFYEMIGRLPQVREEMPPFSGTEDERRALAQHLGGLAAESD